MFIQQAFCEHTLWARPVLCVRSPKISKTQFFTQGSRAASPVESCDQMWGARMANLLAGGAAWCGFEQDCDALGAVCCWG